MKPDVALEAEGVSKKFCLSLGRAMRYGCADLARDALGLRSGTERLRPREFWAVDDVSFDLKQGECLGLVGPNGAGKSTLFKVLNGIIRPDRGTVRARGRLGALIEVGAGFHQQLTGRENIYVNAAILGMTRREIGRKLDAIIDFADIGDFLDTPVKFYSSGMFVRLGMAVAVHTDPQILLVDEVFAVGDMNFQAKCFNRIGELRRQGTSFILVSHNVHHIAAFADRGIVMDRGRIVTSAPASEAIESYVSLMDDRRRGAGIEHEERPAGSGRVRFGRIFFSDESDNPIEVARSVDAVVLNVHFNSSVEAQDVELDVAMLDGHGRTFFRGCNGYCGQPLRIGGGRGEIRVRFPCLPANNDTLVVNVALWNKERTEIFDWRQRLVLRVDGCARSAGSVWLDCRFECHPYDAVLSEGRVMGGVA